MKKGLFKNEVEMEELKNFIFLKKFYWGETISSMMRFIEKLEDEDIKYTIETNTKFRCQNIFISKVDERETIVKGII